MLMTMMMNFDGDWGEFTHTPRALSRFNLLKEDFLIK
jgi:hypothetical protein